MGVVAPVSRRRRGDPVLGRHRVRASARARSRSLGSCSRSRASRSPRASRAKEAAAVRAASAWRSWLRSAFGLYFVFADRAADESVAVRGRDRPRVVALRWRSWPRWSSARRCGPAACTGLRSPWSGLCDVGANMLFSLATTRGYLSIVSVLASLYPDRDGRPRCGRAARARLADAAARRRGRPRRRRADHRRLSVNASCEGLSLVALRATTRDVPGERRHALIDRCSQAASGEADTFARRGRADRDVSAFDELTVSVGDPQALREVVAARAALERRSRSQLVVASAPQRLHAGPSSLQDLESDRRRCAPQASRESIPSSHADR